MISGKNDALDRADKVVNLKSIAMPAQHGVWGFWLEPSLAALIVAPSWAGFCLALAGLGVLLLHRPLTIWVKDSRKGKSYARTSWAGRFVALFGGGALVFFVAALLLGEPGLVASLALALPFALVQLAFELRNQGRHILAEIGGAIAFVALAPMIVLAGGGSWGVALGVWVVMIIRTLVSIPYIRTRLRLEKAKQAASGWVIGLHIVGIVALIASVVLLGVPWLTLVGGGVLLVRAVFGMTALRKPTPVKVIGFREIAYGLTLAILTGLGYGV
jgi:hypothetical protein